MATNDLNKELGVQDAEVHISNIMNAFIQDSNGDDVYDSERVQLGYIEAPLNLQILKSYHNQVKGEKVIKFTLGEIQGLDMSSYADAGTLATYATTTKYCAGMIADATGSHDAHRLTSLKHVMLNYLALKAANVNKETAILCAALRSRWIDLGCYHALCQFDKTTKSEVTIINDNNPAYGNISKATTFKTAVMAMASEHQDFVKLYLSKDSETLRKWVVTHAEHIWAASEYAFRVRGHHFQEKSGGKTAVSMESLLTRFLQSSFEGNFEVPDGFDFQRVFHTCIHPFKIAPLPIMVHHFAMHKKVSSAAMVRFSGAPTGNAAITTTCAALSTMAGESWFGAFKTVFSDEIALLERSREAIIAEKFAYHQAAGLYGIAKKSTIKHGDKEVRIDVVKEKTSVLAAACQGLIMGINEAVASDGSVTFAMSNAMALKKAASNNPMISMKVKTVVISSINKLSEKDDPEASLVETLTKTATARAKFEKELKAVKPNTTA